jgi:hypothetical protein
MEPTTLLMSNSIQPTLGAPALDECVSYLCGPTQVLPVNDEQPVIDPLTGKTVPKCFIKVHRFLRASTGTRRTGECKQNREWLAYLAHKGIEDWPYRGMPLSTVTTYLRWRGMP